MNEMYFYFCFVYESNEQHVSLILYCFCHAAILNYMYVNIKVDSEQEYNITW
jgi:hypothetical protein